MVRLGSVVRAQDLVLGQRPESIVSAPEDMGRCSAYAIGSGMDAGARDEVLRDAIVQACDSGAPIVFDAGALDFAMRSRGPALVTPHAGELARMLGWLGHTVERSEIEAAPDTYALQVAEETGSVVLLKGSLTYIVTPEGRIRPVEAPTSRLATAGSGDVLTGILGSLAAQNAAQLTDADALASMAEAGVGLHGAAAKRIGDRPLVALDIAESVAEAITEFSN